MASSSGLRERKRVDTKRRIVDSATALVLDSSYADVTVDDICLKAGISRRTFFNYVESKGEAVFGQLPTSFDEKILDDASNLPLAFLTVLGQALHANELGDESFAREIKRRRKAIFAADPSLAALSFERLRSLSQAITDLTSAHLTAHPNKRRLTHLSIEEEARIITVVVHSAFVLSCDGDPVASAKNLSSYMEALTW